MERWNHWLSHITNVWWSQDSKPGLCCRVCALHHPTTCLAAPTRTAEPRGQSSNKNHCSCHRSWVLWPLPVNKNNGNLRPNPWSFKSKVSARGCLYHFPGKKKPGLDPFFLETKKIVGNFFSFWGCAKVRPGRLWAWPPSNSQSWAALDWGERESYLPDGGGARGIPQWALKWAWACIPGCSDERRSGHWHP